jgi:hypothetical protein
MTKRTCWSSTLKAQQVRTQHHIASLAELPPVRVHRVARESCRLSFTQFIVIVMLMDCQDCRPADWRRSSLGYEQPGRYPFSCLYIIGDERSRIGTLIDL